MPKFDFCKTPFTMTETSSLLLEDVLALEKANQKGLLCKSVEIHTGFGKTFLFPNAYDIIEYKVKSSTLKAEEGGAHYKLSPGLASDLIDLHATELQSMIEFIDGMKYNYIKTIESTRRELFGRNMRLATSLIECALRDLNDVLSGILKIHSRPPCTQEKDNESISLHTERTGKLNAANKIIWDTINDDPDFNFD